MKLSPEAIDPSDPGMLQDLIVIAINDAIVQCQDLAQNNLKLPPGMGGGF